MLRTADHHRHRGRCLLLAASARLPPVGVQHDLHLAAGVNGDKEVRLVDGRRTVDINPPDAGWHVDRHVCLRSGREPCWPDSTGEDAVARLQREFRRPPFIANVHVLLGRAVWRRRLDQCARRGQDGQRDAEGDGPQHEGILACLLSRDLVNTKCESRMTARWTATGAYSAGVGRPLLLVAAVVLVGCGGGTTGTTVQPGAATAGPTATRSAGAPEATETSQPSQPIFSYFEPITLSGEGKKVEELAIPLGVAAIAEIIHNGESNFVVNTIDASGDQVDGLVNEIGDYKGTVFIEPSEDDPPVALEIDADGAWTVTIKHVTDAMAWDSSTALEGTGDSVYQVEPPSAGLVTLELTYHGESNFIVRTYSGTYDGLDDIANEIGDFMGEVLLPDGTFLLEITANEGTWTATPG
jgi:hypothetical protein